MFPAQTSLIPATVALVKWIEVNGFSGLYPFWYLGTAPVKYLIGPVVPGIMIGLHKILPNLSLFNLSLLSVVSCQLLMSAGWGVLAGRLSGSRMVGWWVGILSLVMPWHWVSGFALSELSAVFAGTLTPWVLLGFIRSVRHFEKPFGLISSNVRNDSVDVTYASARQDHTSNSKHNSGLASSYFSKWLPSLTFSGLLLTNAVAAIPAIVGLAILGIVLSKRWEDGFKKVGKVILVGWLVATLWYGPGFWLTIWGAPSLGGRSAFLALGWIVDMFRGMVPIILAVGVVLVGIRPKDNYSKFAYTWFGVFAVLTLLRFMADPDFWMDWTAWMGEVEVGMALLVVRNFQFTIFNLRRKYQANDIFHSIFKFQITKKTILYSLFTIYLLGGWFWAYKARDFWLPRKDVSQSVEFKVASELKEIVKSGEIVFLSGTTAFWLNSLVDIAQIRGGVDQASIDSTWRQVTWDLRQGAITEGTEKVLRALKISYLVVHTDESGEFYHDFVNVEIFENMSYLQKVYDREGDRIYEVK